MSTTYQVVAPLVLVKDEAGVTHHAYQGAVLEDLGREQVDHLLGLGFIAKVGSDAAVVVPGREFLDPAQVEESEAEAEAGRPVEVPAKAARHDLWVDYAVAKGADRTEAQAQTKADLIELYG